MADQRPPLERDVDVSTTESQAPDLLSIALLVFFISLLVVVAALMVLPAILG